VQTSIESLFITEVLIENHILRSQHRFTAHIIGIHPFPSARQGTAVEDNHQSMIIGIAQDSFIQTHGLLLVTTEKIDLDTFNSLTLQPFHFTLACNGVIHQIRRSLLDIIPVTTRTIPQKHIYLLASRIPDKLFHTFVTDIRIPPIIYQCIFISHGSSQIDITHLVIIIDTAILPEYPAPGSASHTIVMFRFVQRFDYIPRNSRFYNRLQRFSYGNSTPGRRAG